MIIKYISIGLLALYAYFVLTAWSRWRRTPVFKGTPKNYDDAAKIAVVVCCRNEEENIRNLYDSICRQTLQPAEIVIANDHSTDATPEIIQALGEKDPRVTTFSTQGFGKKNALREAVDKSSAPLIVCTDADCTLPYSHLSDIAAFQEKYHADMILGGVKLSPATTLFQKLQAIEFSSLIASGAAAAFANTPFLCNGANLAFTRNSWERAKNHLQETLKSGDDIFMLQYLKQQHAKIMYMKSENLVATRPMKSVSAFFNQRKRWGSKTTAYSDSFSIFVALLVFLLSLMMVVAVGLSFFNVERFLCFALAMFLTKLAADFPLLKNFLASTGQRHLIALIPLAALLYPFYIVVAALGAIFGSFKWK